MFIKVFCNFFLSYVWKFFVLVWDVIWLALLLAELLLLYIKQNQFSSTGFLFILAQEGKRTKKKEKNMETEIIIRAASARITTRTGEIPLLIPKVSGWLNLWGDVGSFILFWYEYMFGLFTHILAGDKRERNYVSLPDGRKKKHHRIEEIIIGPKLNVLLRISISVYQLSFIVHNKILLRKKRKLMWGNILRKVVKHFINTLSSTSYSNQIEASHRQQTFLPQNIF